ncbi:MAG: S41 family peptidase [Planctomycetaceae bacterium]
MRLKTRLYAALLLFTIPAASYAAQAKSEVNAGMLRSPDVSKDKIVFVYANDLWVVDRAGGQARPLASPPGTESMPRFSPDGKTIAFVGNYDGGRDIYSIAVDGGIPERHTWHPARESLCDWTADGGIVYSSNGFSGLARISQLFHLAADSPEAKRLAVPYGTNAALSADGEWLAYTPHSRDTRTWKRYRGGMASDIWLFNLKTNKSRQITDWEGTDSFPMWAGSRVFYLSDNGPEHRLNIWSFDVNSGKREQHTKFDKYDVKWPSIGPGADGKGEIVLQNGSDLHVLNCESGKTEVVKVSVPGAKPKLRNQIVDVAENITSGDISPSGKRVVVGARGDIWTAPAKNGSPRNLTRTSGVAERDPSWSPDGRWIAYFADKSGEYELYVQQSDGKGKAKRLTEDGKVFRYSPTWSPDSKHIVFTDKTGGIWLHTVESGETQLVDTDPWANQPDVSWSHDSSWLTYERASDTRAPKGSIWLYDVNEKKRHQLTSGFFNDESPVFDRKGDFIFYTSNRAFNSPKYEDTGTTFVYSDTGVLVAIPLREDVKIPMLPSSDEQEFKSDEKKSDGDDSEKEEPNKEEPKSEDKKTDKDAKDADKKDEKKEPLKIDIEDAERRSFLIPVKQGNFGSLAVNDKGQLLYVRVGSRGVRQPPVLQLFDLKDEKKKEQTVAAGVGSYSMTADGKKLLAVGSGPKFYVIKAAAGQKLSDSVSTAGMMASINPREEWQQIFADAWRIERDFFYDPNMHGTDWYAVRKQYEAMLADCVSREDVGFVIGEMIAELNVGHAYYRPGGGEDEPRSKVGVLGCEFEFDGAWKFGKIFEGAAWDTDARNPLRHVGIKSGEYLLAVNGLPVETDRPIFAALDNTAGRTVTLTISENKELGDDDDRDVVVKPMANDYELRFRAWIEQNRKYVEEKTDGKVGYLYVTNTGVPGQNDLVRHLYGQINKDALIVDERWNGGGQIPTRFIELLNRPVTNYWARRDGHDMTWPPDSHQGPKCMLINGMSGSGGDMFPALFKQNNLGKLIGRRTWGGLVGISGNPGLIDGAGVTAPTFAYYEKDGTWGIEGHGVDPDIDVVDDPALMIDGGDPQLDAAIKHIKGELKKNPYKPVQRPEYPDRKGFGLKESDK